MLKRSSIEKLLEIAERLKNGDSGVEIGSYIESILKEGMVSKHKSSLEEIEEQLETAIQKYYQLTLAPNDLASNHWLSNLESALINLEKANKDLSFRRGFIHYQSKIDQLVAQTNFIGFDLACQHLDEYLFESDDPKVVALYFDPNLNLEKLYFKIERAKPNYKTKYES